MLKVGLAGVGGISETHIPAWEQMEDVELVALCDIRPEQLELHPGKRCYTDFDEMLRCEELDIIDLCVPTYLHAQFAEKALKRGIHTVCEKPLSLDPADAKRLFALARENNVKFIVAQVVRFMRSYVLLKELYDSGKYGRLLSLSMRRISGMPMGSHDHWMHQKEKSGHAAFDMHIHDLDYCIHTFGAPKKASQHRVNLPDQDWIHAVYEYEGFCVSVEAAWFNAPYGFKADFRAQFEKAVMANEDGKLYILDQEGNQTDLKQSNQFDLRSSESTSGGTIVPSSDGYYNELRYFADCVRDNKPQELIQDWQIETGLKLAKAFG